MPVRFRALLVALALLLPAGCLEIDGEEVTIHQDVEKDQLDVHIVYRGLFAELDSDKDAMAKALKDLDAAKESGTFVFWNNWPLKVDLTRAKGSLATLAQHIEVENGGLFTDPLGVLCAQQFVRVHDLGQFVTKVNTLLELALAKATTSGITMGGEQRKFDDDSKDLLREFLRNGEKLLVVQPGRVELRLPISTPDHRWLKRQLERHFLQTLSYETVARPGVAQRRAAGGSPMDTSVDPKVVSLDGDEVDREVQRAPAMRFAWDNDLSMMRTAELTTVAFGTGEGDLRLTKASGGLYHDRLLANLRERGEKIDEGVPDQELERQFAAFRGRDAVLPPALAEQRVKTAK